MVGLTGGIGSGKSAVARRLAELGALVIDADAPAREVVAPGTEGLAEVVAAFGPEVLAPDGTMDRTNVASIVFGDDEKRRRHSAYCWIWYFDTQSLTVGQSRLSKNASMYDARSVW